jgi:hypothetical protein
MKGSGSPSETIKTAKAGRGKAIEGIKGGGPQAKVSASKWAKRMKWLRPILIFAEFIPYVGALPYWTICVFAELKNN